MPPRSLALLAASLALPACGETRAATPTRRAAAAASATAEAPPTPPAPRDCPEEMARVDRACIDRWEAHLVTRAAGGREERHPHHQRPREGVTYEARSAPGALPQAYVSRVEAEAACVAAGKRLCSRREWQRACRSRGAGAAAGAYPYGDRREPGRCNTDKPHLVTLLFGPDARRWRYADFNDPALSNQPGFLARTGEYAGCVGELGVADLVGNLHEWVSDRADRAFEAALRAEGIPRAYQHWAPGNAVFMGGFFSTHEELGPGCAFTTIAHDAGYHDYSTGFRCCAEVRPSP